MKGKEKGKTTRYKHNTIIGKQGIKGIHGGMYIGRGAAGRAPQR